MADTTKQSPPIEEEESRDLWSVSSLASTANDLVFEYGRRFPNHRINTSPFPGGDQLSRDNEQALHNLNLCIYDDRLFIAPINNPTNVLDVQCGELGLWSKDMADRYPEAQITGMDKYVPDTEGRENLSFNFQIFTDDPWVLDEITQVYGKFDLIYIRAIFGSNCDLQGLYQRCMEHLTPGGYIEQCEIVPYCQCSDGTSRKDSVMARICSLIPTFESNLAVNYNPGADMAEVMEKVGFTDIKQDIRNCPWSPWHPPGTKEYEIGCYLQKYYETGIHGWIVTPLRKHVGMDADTVENMVKAATIEIQQNDQHWWSPVITVTARKPTDTPA